MLMTPVVKVFDTDSFYEKAFASTSAVCILFAGAVAKNEMNQQRLEALLSSDTVFILFVACCCIVFFVFAFQLFFKCYRYCFTKLVQPKVEQNYFDHRVFSTQQERRTKSLLVTKWMCDILQYSIMITYSYWILKDTNFLPPVMFGKGHVRNAFIGKLDEKLFESTLKPYYLIQLGIHTYSLFYQMLGFGNNAKYYEFCFHHFLAFFLILFSYSLGEIRIGALVLLIHEVCDVTYPLGRVYFDYKKKYKILEAILVTTMLCSWTLTRMIIYPFWVPKIIELLQNYQQIAKETFLLTYETIFQIQDPYFDKSNNFLLIFFSFLLFMLVVIHYYWGLFMHFATYTAFVKRKSKFSYEKLNVNTGKE